MRKSTSPRPSPRGGAAVLKKAPHPGARLVAENLGDNCFAVTAENVARFTLFLAPPMADLEKEVEVTVNGRVFRGKTDHLEGNKDYTAQLEIAL